jgi:nucleotide-binding universal stress UspA family protein
MYKQIMVPVDLAHADHLSKALSTAADLAKHYGAPVCYVGVTASAPSAVAHNPAEYDAKLDAFAQTQAGQHGISATSKSMISNDPVTDVDDALLKAEVDAFRRRKVTRAKTSSRPITRSARTTSTTQIGSVRSRHPQSGLPHLRPVGCRVRHSDAGVPGQRRPDVRRPARKADQAFDWFFLRPANIFVVVLPFPDRHAPGAVRLGGKDATPDYTYIGWFAMLFAAGMGIGLMFFGVLEPIYHMAISEPLGRDQTARRRRQSYS